MESNSFATSKKKAINDKLSNAGNWRIVFFEVKLCLIIQEIIKRQTDPYTARRWISKQNNKTKSIYIFKNLPNISVYKKNEDKTKSSLQIRVWKNENKNNRLLLV